LDYDENNKNDEDEVEDLYRLLSKVKKLFPEVKGVSCGAILSDYQRNRLENV
jgi:diphthine-ammonia ligase